MALKVIGTGFGRTGTSSLKLALEGLGVSKCYHMKEVFEHPEHIPLWDAAARGEPVDWDTIFDGFAATVDWPGAAMWREIWAAYPDAKFIHSERDEDAWLRSFSNTIRNGLSAGDAAAGPPGWSQMVDRMISQKVFGGRMDDDTVCRAAYRRNSEEVRAEIPADRLLVFQPEAGWGPLCDFLGVPVPDTPYPHENTTADFQKLMAELTGGGGDA